MTKRVQIPLPVGEDDVLRARRLLAQTPSLSLRDCIHLGVMEGAGLVEILSYDRGFDLVPWVRRRDADSLARA